MKQTFLLMVLALGMCCINVSAQVNGEQYRVEEDGFEWYYVYSDKGYVGAKDKYGNTLIPTTYGDVYYHEGYDGLDIGHFIAVEFISYPQGITDPGRRIIYNKKGEAIFKTWNKYEFLNLTYIKSIDKFYISVSLNGKDGIINRNNQLIIPCIYQNISAPSKFPIEVKENDTWKKLSQNEMDKFLIPGDFLKKNTNNSSSHGSSTSSNNSSNNNNSENKTTTVVVEHRRNPVPMQEWQACFGCGGMGKMGCDGCGGSGTRYGVSDRLRVCSRCNGRGIIPCNVCYGNKGQYITVYR